MYTSSGYHIWDDNDADDDGTSEDVAVTQRKRGKALGTAKPTFNIKFQPYHNYGDDLDLPT